MDKQVTEIKTKILPKEPRTVENNKTFKNLKINQFPIIIK